MLKAAEELHNMAQSHTFTDFGFSLKCLGLSIEIELPWQEKLSSPIKKNYLLCIIGICT